MGYSPILDRAPKGRNEGDQPMSWLRRHDDTRASEPWTPSPPPATLPTSHEEMNKTPLPNLIRPTAR